MEGGVLKSSLTAAFPSLPPASVYAINVPKSSLRLLFSKSQSNSSVGEFSTGQNDSTGGSDEARNSNAYHTCVVLSRWTAYSDVKKAHGFFVGDQCTNRGFSVTPVHADGGLPLLQESEAPHPAVAKLGDTQDVCGRSLMAINVQGDPACQSVISPANPHQAQPSQQRADEEQLQTSTESPTAPFGKVMQQLKHLDAAEFFLLYDHLQKRLRSVAMAAASPVVDFDPWISTCCTGVCCPLSCRRSEGGDSCIAKQMQHMCLTPSEGSASIGKEDSSAGPDSHPPGVGDTGVEFDSVGNEVGAKHFLRDQLSSLYSNGVLIDRDGWCEMTIEPIARYMAVAMGTHSQCQAMLELSGCVVPSFPQLNNSEDSEGTPRVRWIVAADGCCGLGGDIMHLQQVFDFVIGVDRDLLRIAICRHNAGLVRSHLRKNQRSCCPLLLLYDELQHVAALRSGWSVRDSDSIRDSVHRLTLSALRDHQAKRNVGLEILIEKQQWRRRCSGAEVAASESTDNHTALDVKGAASDKLSSLCVCVPFSRAVCPFCADCADSDYLFDSKDKNTNKELKCIEPVPGDFLPLDWTYISPPWGGENYPGRRNIQQETFFPSRAANMVDLIVSCAKLSPNVCLFLPRSSDLHEILAVASALKFPLVDVEVLYISDAKDQKLSKGRRCCTFPKALVVYLIKEVRPWIEARGIPNSYAYEFNKLKGGANFMGWRSSDEDVITCKSNSNGVFVPFEGFVRTSEKPPFAFCDLQLKSETSCQSSHLFGDVLDGVRNSPNKACRVDFSTFLGHVETALTDLLGSLGSGRELSLDLLQNIRDGKLDLALTKFDKLLSSHHHATGPK